MTYDREQDERVALHVNGHLMAVAQESGFKDFERALRGVALSDSPVLIRAKDAHCGDLVDRLHKLGRRNQQPVHQCRHPEEAERLFRVVLDSKDEGSSEVLGTWALHQVDAWPREMQLSLHRVLEQLDRSRLHGRLRHESIPRVVVLQDAGDRTANLEPQLAERLSYFSLETRPHVKKVPRS